MRKPYPSDLTDEQWAVIEPLIPVNTIGRPREVSMREVLDAYGFDVEIVRGFAPGDRRRPIIDGIASRFPGLSRRFLILARKRAAA